MLCTKTPNVRHGMVAMLQPRPRQNPSAAPVRGRKGSEIGPHRHKAENRKERATGKELRKKKAKAKVKEKNKWMENWEKSWFSEKTTPDGQTKPICMRYNLLQCTVPKCTFAHCCPVPESDGSMCGSTDHTAIACPHRSREVSTWGQLPVSGMATGVWRPLPKPHHDSGSPEKSRQTSDPDTDPLCPSLELTPSLSVTQSKPTEPTAVAQAPAKYFFRGLCWPHRTTVSRSHQGSARSPGTSRRRPPVGSGDTRPH